MNDYRSNPWSYLLNTDSYLLNPRFYLLNKGDYLLNTESYHHFMTFELAQSRKINIHRTRGRISFRASLHLRTSGAMGKGDILSRQSLHGASP